MLAIHCHHQRYSTVFGRSEKSSNSFFKLLTGVHKLPLFCHLNSCAYNLYYEPSSSDRKERRRRFHGPNLRHVITFRREREREGGKKGRRTIKVSTTTTTTAVRPSTPRSLGVCAPRGHSGRLSGARGSLTGYRHLIQRYVVALHSYYAFGVPHVIGDSLLTPTHLNSLSHPLF